MKVSKSFEAFHKEAPETSKAWQEFIMKHGEVSSLDEKTQSLSYLAVLAAARLESGIPFHVHMAKLHGATKDEVVSAILVGLPAVGNIVTNCLPVAIEAYDNESL